MPCLLMIFPSSTDGPCYGAAKHKGLTCLHRARSIGKLKAALQNKVAALFAVSPEDHLQFEGQVQVT